MLRERMLRNVNRELPSWAHVIVLRVGSSSWFPRRGLLWLMFVSSWTFCATAHHNTGASPSESLRTLSSLGNNPAPRQRIAALASVMRSSEEPALSSQTTYGLSLLCNIRIAERFYGGLEAPFVVVDEDVNDQPIFGYGNTRLSFQWALENEGRIGGSRFSLGMAVSMPTRTFAYETDPGKQWLFVPGFRYGHGYGNLFWYALALFPLETRPAGTAWDVSSGLGIGYRFLSQLSISLGASVDVRAVTWCKGPSETQVCPAGRATESNRAHGATRASAVLSSSWDVTGDVSLLVNGQLPLTRRKDVEWGISGGAEVRF